MLRTKRYTKTLFYIFLFATLNACIINDNIKDSSVFINPGNDPNFTIVTNTDRNFEGFNRKVLVFDIPIYATKTVEDAKLLHAANILAQYLDNDEDGLVDNLAIQSSMKTNKAYLFMWKTALEKNSFNPPNGYLGQDLGADETVENFVSGGLIGPFDAALEEVWHLISRGGYANAYATIFGENTGTALTNAMDIARGGKFTSIPVTYPASAWYTYKDATCNYNCQATEYMYWAMSSILGAQKNRFSSINNEWKLNTKSKVQTTDAAIYKLLTDPKYKFPTVLPNGLYKR